MTKTTLRLSVALLACLLLALPVAAKDVARVSVSAGDVVFTPEVAAAGFQLTVTGPGGYLYTETFDGSGAMAWLAAAADGSPLADGAYSYELRPVAQQVQRGSAAGLAGAKAGLEPLSGTVTVRGGSLVSPDRPEQLTKDQVIADDLIVQGSICVGFDCVNNESFGADTLRLKENNLRIHFDDTSSTGSFPSNDWRLIANDQTNGGASYFAIEDSTAGRQIFRTDAGAPANSLYVDSAGNVGVGTSTPVVEIHVKDGDSPALRLEQDGSSGFTAQTWDMAGNETNWFVRDVTSGSKLPLRVEKGAPSYSINIEGNGNVGFGTQNPSEPIHVTRSDAARTTVLVENTNGTAQNVDVQLKNNAATWSFRAASTGTFVLNETSDGAAEAELDGNGNLTILGGLVTGTAGSCTVGTPCDGVFASDYALPSIEEHAAAMWQNSYLPAVGPTLPNQPINLTLKTTGILNELEKAHIYIEQLNDSVTEQRKELASQQELIQQLSARLAALEQGN